MKRTFQFSFSIFFCFMISSAISQMTIEVSSVPQLTPMLDDIYVAGSFNDWNPSDENFKLTEQDGIYSIVLTGTENATLEFKFTRGGNWDTVEGDENGTYIPNRSLTFLNGTTAALSIEGWEDQAGAHTVTPEVRILDNDFFIPQLKRNRRIWIRFPVNYENTTDNYPVIYMHDAQNVFDAATSFVGEWTVDEVINNSVGSGCADVIVVGIDNGGADRMNEYSPWHNSQYNGGGQGDEYADFVAETLKPYIDQNFRTLTDRNNTFNAGSSLGGLIAMFITTKHNDIFGGAGIFSPAFWFNPEIYDYVDDAELASDTKLYFVCGDAESGSLVDEMIEMQETAVMSGVYSSNTASFVQQGGQHNEYWWAQYYPAYYSFQVGCSTDLKEEQLRLVCIYPNPAQDKLLFDRKGNFVGRCIIRDINGKSILEKTIDKDYMIDISTLPAGSYTIQFQCMPAHTSTVISDVHTFIKK